MNLSFRTLTAREIECRVAQVSKNGSGLSLLLYKDARCDMAILDETVGAMNWQRKHGRENANCIVSIWDDDKRAWIEKEDTGTESNTEAEKGLASDSFKRACVNWGIGRELYTSPFIWITGDKCKIEEFNGKFSCKDHFEVTDIGYNEHREICRLSIYNTSRKTPVFSFEDGKPQKVEATPNDEVIKADAKEISPEYNTEKKATPAHLELLREYYKGANLAKLLKANNIERLEDMPALKAGQLLSAKAQKEARK